MTMNNYHNAAILIVILSIFIGSADPSTSNDSSDQAIKSSLTSDQFTVEHNGIGMALHRKQLTNLATDHNKILVLLPSATYSTTPNWDLQYNDSSVMDFFANSGWVVFAIDLPGYGQSDNPLKPATFGAIESTDYIRAAVEFICEEQETENINLLGWSWGAQAAGRFANTHPHLVNKLVLYGFTYRMRLPAAALPDERYRRIDYEGALSDFIEGCHEQDLPKKYAEAVLASDQDQLAPSGPINDYVNRLPIVEPALLPMPVLVLCGQYEIEQPPNLAGNYSNHFQARRHDLESFCRQLPARQKELVVIDGGGHAVHLEKPKHKWRQSVHSFFEE
jgi:pimeloyl-ACP methyl ester carboxylesterase